MKFFAATLFVIVAAVVADVETNMNDRAASSVSINQLGNVLKMKQIQQTGGKGGMNEDLKKQCDAEKEHLQSEIDALRAEVKELKAKGKNKRLCCKALTANCLACAEGVSVEEFCKDKKGVVNGCPKKNEDDKKLKPNKPGRMCCMAMTAKCIACSRGVSVEDFCKDMKNFMPGCPNPTTTGIEEEKEEDENERAKTDDDIKNDDKDCEQKVEKCCRYKYSPTCIACRARNQAYKLKYELCKKTKASDDTEKDEDEEDEEKEDPVLTEPRPNKFDGPCMFDGKIDKDAPFCHDYDRMWGMPSDYDPQTKTRKYGTSLLQVEEGKDIKWVVSLVKKIEAAYPKDNWKTLATRLRKIVYFGKLWDMLIPKAKKTPVLTVKGEATQDVINSLTRPNLNVKDPTGQQIDLNHVWVGIDVANYPTTNLLVRIFGGLKGPAVATWAGDVGSVLGEYYYKTQGEGDIARYYEIMSGDDDMYSNADGYGIALQKLPKGSGSWKLSKRIEYYYEHNINKRVTYMCDAAGIKFHKRGRKKGRLKYFAKKKVAAQIRRFAKLWRIHQCPHGWKKCVIPTSKDPLHQKPKTAHTAKLGKTYLKSEREYVTNKFIKWLETHLKEEN